MSNITKGYEIARDKYLELGIDVDWAMDALDQIPLSVHCWQCDDVSGFEHNGEGLTGGIQATGNYPGKAKNPTELRADLQKALSYIPGRKKVNLHACYLEAKGEKVDRNEIEPKHFENWVEWAVNHKLGLDFNPTYFSHPKASDNYTLSHSSKEIRDFFIEHGIRSRIIAEYFGRETGEICINNIWVPDGEKEFPIDTLTKRDHLKESLDQILNARIENKHHINAVESKLFGIGSEAYVVGSHEFYLGYAMSRKDTLLTLDTGHFHPTETVTAKISAILLFLDRLLIHLSRPVRWDSDHVVIFDDETRLILKEIARINAFDRVYLATDYFDGSINRIMALAIGARNIRKALLEALLQPVQLLKQLEAEGDFGQRLALSEELKTLPFHFIWEYYLEKNCILGSLDWIKDAKDYENTILKGRI